MKTLILCILIALSLSSDQFRLQAQRLSKSDKDSADKDSADKEKEEEDSENKKVYFFNKCTFTKSSSGGGCEFKLASKQYIWGLGSCQQRIDGKENKAFDYLSLMTGKKVCCSNGKDYKIKMARGSTIQLELCIDITNICNEPCDGPSRRRRLRRKRKNKHKRNTSYQ
jgi:hypothetical protein